MPSKLDDPDRRTDSDRASDERNLKLEAAALLLLYTVTLFCGIKKILE